MIHYILGHAGKGKTTYALGQFDACDQAIFLGVNLEDRDTIALGDEFSKKSLIELGDAYREYLDEPTAFTEQVYQTVAPLLDQNTTIFFDEFQLYASDQLVEAIINAQADCWVIHQFPRQIESHFSPLWDLAESKYLLDPYQPSEFYQV